MTKSAAQGPFDWLDSAEVDAWQALLALVRIAFPEIARQLRDDHDMLTVHYHILVSLHEAPDHTLQLTDLASAAALSQSRLTQRLRTLTDRGDVEINTVPNDRRAKRATLTPQGKRRLLNAAPSHGETVRRIIFDHLSSEQVKAIGDALRPVVESLGKHPEYVEPTKAPTR